MLGPSALGHPYRVGGSSGDVMRAWVKQSLLILGFIISKLHYCYISYIFVLDKRNTAWLRDTEEITYPFPNVNGFSIGVWELISNFIPYIIMDVITHPFWD